MGQISPTFFGRAHANGSIRRGHKNDATEAVSMRTGLGINLKEVKVFNRGREKGKFLFRILGTFPIILFCMKSKRQLIV